MKDLQAIITILNFLGLGGLGAFLYFLVKGLAERINSLTELANEQKKTLDAVRDRAEESDRLSQCYKKAIDDFQDIGDKLENKRKALVVELENANAKKDEELARLRKLEIQEIELKSESLKKIPELEKKLEQTIEDLEKQLTIVSPKTLAIFSQDLLSDNISCYKNLIKKSYESIQINNNLDNWIIGSKGVGKTAILNYWLSKNYDKEAKIIWQRYRDLLEEARDKNCDGKESEDGKKSKDDVEKE